MKSYYGNILKKIYLSALGKFVRKLGYLIGLLAGTVFFFPFFQFILGFPPSRALIYSVLFYGILLFLLFIFKFIRITVQLFKKPETVLVGAVESKTMTQSLMAKAYGIEKVLAKEICKIHKDGSFDSNCQDKLITNVRNIRAIQIYSEYLGPAEAEISIDKVTMSVTPIEYRPLELKKIGESGLYVLCFGKEIEPGEEITIGYNQAGKGEIFATSVEKCPHLLHFEYLVFQPLYPTRELWLEIDFDAEYPVSVDVDRPKAVVWYGDAKLEHEKETQRASENFTFEGRKAILRITYLIHGLEYGIKWTIKR